MKELMKKITVILVLMMMLINSSLLLIISTAVDAIEEIIDETKINPLYEINLEKYVNYSIEDSKGIVVQINLKTGIEYREGQEYKPLNSTGVLLNLPKIEDEYPESIEVIGKSTKATNGSDIAKDFTYVYDKETGEMKLAVVNKEDDNGNIYSENVDGARDEYTIICYYTSNCYNGENVERNLEVSGFVQANIANDSETRKKSEIIQNYTVTENVSGLISTTIQTSDIYNGYINSNSQNGTSYSTEYIENLEIDISKKELSDEITISTEHSFVNKKDETIDTDEIVYKSTKIDKNKVLDILGEDGYLQILNENGDVLGELNKDTEVGENGIYEVTYGNELNEIIIKTSKPLKVGTIILQNIKEIKETMTDIENNKIQVKNNISCVNNVKETNKIIDEETNEEKEITNEYAKEVYNFSNDNVTEIKDSETRVDLSIDKSEWTNNVQNDVVMTATLVTNDIKYNLFKNPVIEIKLPSEVEKVILGDVNLLYDNNLSVLNAEVIEKESSKVIKIEITGIQSEYIYNDLINGAEVVIPAIFIISKEVESIETNIKYTYANELGVITDYEREGEETKDINIKIDSINVTKKMISSLSKESDVTLSSSTVNGLKTEVIARVGKDYLGENDTVYEGEVITFTVRMTNESNVTINNPKAVCNIPEGGVYVTRNERYSDTPIEGDNGYVKNELYDEYSNIKTVQISKDVLESEEIYEKKYDVLVKYDESNENLLNEIRFYLDDNEIDNKTINFKIKPAQLSLHLYPAQKEYFGRYSYLYDLVLNNLTNNDFDNVTVEVAIGKELEYRTTRGEGIKSESYDENTGILTLVLENVKGSEKREISIRAAATKFEDNKYEYDVQFSAVAYTQSENKYRSYLNQNEVETTYFSIIQTSEKEGKNLEYKEEIEYNFNVKNEGNIGTIVQITDDLPDGIIPISAEYEYFKLKDDYITYEKLTNNIDISNKTVIDGVIQPNFKLETYIPAGESIKIKIKAKADSVFKTTEVVNTATVVGDEIFPRTSNGIKNNILYFGYSESIDPDDPDNPDQPDNPDNPDQPDDPDNPDQPDNPDNPDDPSEKNKYNISGLVWIDSDKDGKRSNDEKLFEGIIVKLFNADTNQIVEENSKKVTDNVGRYNFEQVEQGRYFVLFEYDTEKYYITDYQKNKISETVNSDAIRKEVSIDGKIYNVGLTDIINLDRNYSNIDMGLIEKDEFDIRLDKYVTKITISNSNGNKEYNYNNSKLAKVEIPSKLVSETTTTIEYKIVSTNEGNVSGYINEIIDYLPQGLEFDENINSNWKKDLNGNLINNGLSGKEIKPGESKEVTLILTIKGQAKQILNGAEIGDSYNVNGLKDIDSTEKNKDKKEDDYSEAEVIISIKTGIFINIFKIIGLIILLLGIYILVKKIKKQNVKMMMLILLLSINIISFLPLKVYSGVTVGVKYSDLKYHIRNGTWEETGNSNGKYWCINPGVHLCSDGNRSCI